MTTNNGEGADTVNNWQPISTAPKDGSEILAFNGGRGGKYPHWHIVRWIDKKNAWVMFGGHEMDPTHWMKLTEPTP